MPAAWRGALAGLALAGALGAHVAFFTAAGPVDAPSPAAAASWRARVDVRAPRPLPIPALELTPRPGCASKRR